MILMGEPLANYVKSLDCRCELASEARTKTGNELLSWLVNAFSSFPFENDGLTLLFAFFKKSFEIKFLGKKTSFLFLIYLKTS